MPFRDALRLALETLWANRLRSLLTVLGNVVAVLSVVIVVSVIHGLDLFVADQVRSTGSDVFSLTKIGLVMDLESYLAAQARPDLRLDDAEYLAGHLSLASAVVPRVDRWVSLRVRTRRADQVRVSGVGDGYAEVSDLPLAGGRHLAQSDVDARSAVAVVGDGIREKLFDGRDPVGEELRVGRHRYRVVGVLDSRGGGGGESRDDLVFVPVSTLRKQFGGRGSVEILIRASDPDRMTEAQDEAMLQLKIRRGLSPWEKPDFDVVTDAQLFDLYANATRWIFGLLVGVVSLSLLVGGIVVMNVMLVAVTERTREIGVRKALGARRRDIVLQFLVEAVVLSAAGGGIGVLLGVAGALLVRGTTPLPAAVQPWSVVTGLVLASAVGLFFGIYPAHRASRLLPIAALRHEG